MYRLSDRIKNLLKTLDDAGNPRFESFLDIGCGNGEITSEIAKVLKIANCYGADVIEPKSQIIRSSYKKVVDNHIDLPDYSMDLITCFMSIHHFDQYHQMMREIMRLLKPDGYLFIREHDVSVDNTCLINYLNQLHQQFNGYNHGGQPIHYMSRLELKKDLTEQYHLRHVTDSDYPNDVNNRQKIYHSLFRKR
jgi:ubiquinone/menaquinone biosynthesis C-methylase UbiE